MSTWEKNYNKLAQVTKQMQALLPELTFRFYHDLVRPGYMYTDYPAPDFDMYAERDIYEMYVAMEQKRTLLGFIPIKVQIGFIYQSWLSNDTFTLQFPFAVDEKIKAQVLAAYEKVKTDNPTQIFKL